MKILVLLSLVLHISLAFAQKDVNTSMMTDEDWEKSKSLSPQIDQLAKDLGVITKYSKSNHHDSVSVLTTLMINYLENPQSANSELLKKLCGEDKAWDDSFDTLSSCSNSDYRNKLDSQMKDGDNDPIHAAGTQIMHCYDKAEGDPKGMKYMCFNGQLVKADSSNQGANRLMMGYLCTDEKLPVKNQAIVFGSCLEKDQIITEENSCYCQYVNGKKSNGLGWHCTRKI